MLGVFSLNLTTTIEWEAGKQIAVETDIIISAKLVRKFLYPTNFYTRLRFNIHFLANCTIKESVLLSSIEEVFDRGLLYIKGYGYQRGHTIMNKY